MGDDDRAGVVAGRFRLGGLLGSGGTASVFSAVDTVTGGRVAVKLLHPHLSESPAVRAAFLDEARRIAALSHPHVVTIVDLGTFLDGDTPIAWIAQQLVEGVTLAEHVRAEGALTPVEAIAVTADVLSGLAAAHRAGLVHRDVSPANVLVRREGDGLRATLLDFGLADAAGRTAHGDDVVRSSVTHGTAGVVGNAHFASPEQLSGGVVGPAGDLYQAGGLLYFALTARAPFEAGDRAAVVRAHLSAPPPVPSVGRRGIPPALDRVVVRALLKEPAQRYADADQMRLALVAALPAPSRRPTAVAPAAAPAPVVPRTTSVAAPVSAPAATPVSPPPERERRAGAWGLVVGIIAVLAVTATAVPLLSGAGRSVPVAEAATPSGESSPSASAPTAPGTAAPSMSVAPAVVPALFTLTDAPTVLASARLRLGDVVTRDDPAPAGTVLECEPAAGTSVAAGSTVRLVVASGSTIVPEVAGMDAATAHAHLRSSGFVPVTVEIASERPGGIVLAVEPTAGSSVARGSAVRVLVSTGSIPTPTPVPTPSAPSPTATSTPTSAPGPTPSPTSAR